MNPGVKIPSGPITVVHRADGSGTTAIFTDYLAKTSSLWKDAVGSGAAVKWPAASSVGGKGNEGVAANVTRVKNSVGYFLYMFLKIYLFHFLMFLGHFITAKRQQNQPRKIKYCIAHWK